MDGYVKWFISILKKTELLSYVILSNSNMTWMVFEKKNVLSMIGFFSWNIVFKPSSTWGIVAYLLIALGTPFQNIYPT